MANAPTRITAEWLREHGACREDVEVVAREWPGGARPLMATARKAVRLGLDLPWLVWHLLPAPARAAYWEADAQAWAAYREAEAQARAAYREAEAQAWAVYQETTAQALLAGWRALLREEAESDDLLRQQH